MSDMKLHEAIRLGAMMAPQCYHKLFDDKGRVCALGGAMLAGGRNPKVSWKTAHLWLAKQFPILQQRVSYPDWAENWTMLRMPLFSVIVELNDRDQWTREQIADWVQTIEERYESPSSSPSEEPSCRVSVVQDAQASTGQEDDQNQGVPVAASAG